jgi:glycosyltransferase involved in cell wall biosynthesis
VTYGLEDCADRVFYHCVDLLAEVPGIPAAPVSEGEQRLARLGARAIGSSDVVVDHLKAQGFPHSEYWPNVADVDTIRSVRPRRPADIRSNRVVFAGNLSKMKIDFELLRRLAASGVELHLAGPIAEGGGDACDEVQRVVDAGAIYHGMLPLEDLARLYWSASVGLIPYLLNSYTLGVNPLKTFEYLAAGMAVVSTPVPAVRPVVGDVVVVDSLQGFISAVHDHKYEPDPETCERRVQVAEQHSWRIRGQDARNLVHGTADR